MDPEISFGRWMRWRRRTLDLTQDALARRVGCSVVTIRKLESDERRPSLQIAARLADSLQVAAADGQALIAFARAEAPPEALPAAGPPRARSDTSIAPPPASSSSGLLSTSPHTEATHAATLRTGRGASRALRGCGARYPALGVRSALADRRLTMASVRNGGTILWRS